MYVFSFPEVFKEDDERGKYNEQLVIVTNLSHNVTIHVTAIFNDTTVHVTRAVINRTSDPLRVSVMEAKDNNINSTVYTVLLESSDRVNVHAYNLFRNCDDGILIHPVTELGHEYGVLTTAFSAGRGDSQSFFVLTAVADNTSVTISNKARVDFNLSGVAASVPLQVTASWVFEVVLWPYLVHGKSNMSRNPGKTIESR